MDAPMDAPADGVKEEVHESLEGAPAVHAKQEVKKESIKIDMAPVIARLREILPQIDLATTTEKMLRKRLEGELSIDLSSEKAAIRAEVRPAFAWQKNSYHPTPLYSST